MMLDLLTALRLPRIKNGPDKNVVCLKYCNPNFLLDFSLLQCQYFIPYESYKASQTPRKSLHHELSYPAHRVVGPRNRFPLHLE